MKTVRNCGNLKELFELWQEAQYAENDVHYRMYGSSKVPKNSFLPDGIIDADQYAQASRRILFIAKEANWYSEKQISDERNQESVEAIFWHHEVTFGRVKPTMFSNRLAMLCNALNSKDFVNVDKTHKGLQAVAVMNLNKRGGHAGCVWDTLREYTRIYSDYISREIELINPDCIIYCGNDVKWLIDMYINPVCERSLLVSHPSYFALSDSNYLRQLECAVNGESWRPDWKLESKKANAPAEIKGILFDTLSDNALMDMLTVPKISAYGRASRFINSFNIDDYAFYYVRGKGIVACGRIMSDSNMTEYYGDKELYKMVEMIVPRKIPLEVELKAIPPSRLEDNELLGHRFFYASTEKRPYLRIDECDRVISELKRLYSETD